ncbi:2Fe-2S iron-sulfur cluster-binding protein [Shewanella salipaludis]|uniref:2Fe-2S iron-sulfur cluster binding domain-containing protein n=1 Tax=Shewanella salipaludis TaxID=2723052 RepID=A0A972FRB6_9GAMM|nr:2Fe-2S iron-sulfur cluster-binding protein [Shewanella salipaludis]NMH64317.1 2Fe-2S iron-sulfur cluster binding domain-containing protein [Shewanella salipaludis]
MTLFYWNDEAYTAKPGETVLDALVRQGLPMKFSCKKGRCRSCLVRHLEGDISFGAQRGLSEALTQAGYIYACQCYPSDYLKLASPLVDELFVPAHLVDKQLMSDTIVKLIIKPTAAVVFRAGQCINLRRSDGLMRSYAIASLPDTGTFELHIRHKHPGLMSEWLYHKVRVGETLGVQGPWGECCYRPEYGADSLLLVAGGAGLGPALGIVREAIALGHRGPIYLYHSGRYCDDLYWHRELLKLMLAQPNFHYQGCVTAPAEQAKVDGHRIVLGDVLELVAARHRVTREHRIYLCGEPQQVAKGQEWAFLNGVAFDKIHLLAFDYQDLRKYPRS